MTCETRFLSRVIRREGKLVETRVRKNESLEDALRRFKRGVSKDGTLADHYEKPSVKRKLKSEAARKRKKF